MVLREFVRAAKTVVDSGKWVTSVKRLPRTGGPFPMSRSRGLPLGAGWRWRLLRIEAAGSLFRVMLAYRVAKPEFLALVGADIGGDTLVLGALEYHGTHPGWHVHAACRQPGANARGRTRHPEMRRVASGAARCTAHPFPASDGAALEIATRYFRLPLVDHDPDHDPAQFAITFPSARPE